MDQITQKKETKDSQEKNVNIAFSWKGHTRQSKDTCREIHVEIFSFFFVTCQNILVRNSRTFKSTSNRTCKEKVLKKIPKNKLKRKEMIVTGF